MKKEKLIFLKPVEGKSMGQWLIEQGISAGFPSPADDFKEIRISLDRELVKNGDATFYAKVSGDSMINAYIGDGAILIVDRSIEPSHNKIVIAAIDGSYTCKRLLLKPKICLVSENPKYSPILIDREEELEIAGTVIAAINLY